MGDGSQQRAFTGIRDCSTRLFQPVPTAQRLELDPCCCYSLGMAKRLLIVDDHGLVRQGLRLMAEGLGRFDAIVECASIASALSEARSEEGSLALIMLDLGLPDADALDGLDRLHAQCPEVPVIVVSGEEDPRLIDAAFLHGARGYVPKNSSGHALRAAIDAVLGGEVYVPPHVLPSRGRSSRPAAEPESVSKLTPRQSDVLVLLARGLANKEIAEELDMSLSTVRVHVGAIFKLLGVENRTQAAMSPLAQKLLGKSQA
jgi:DNA-binding NarL/FixJ family response regulator